MPNMHNFAPYFNPRPPCGGRLPKFCSYRQSGIFQSTSSVWRTTIANRQIAQTSTISIHVLRVEDDASSNMVNNVDEDFNPRPPCGGRPQAAEADAQETLISIHVLRVEDDRLPSFAPLLEGYFNPRPPCGGRRIVQMQHSMFQQFQSTSSVWRTTETGENRRELWAISIHVLRVEDDKRAAHRAMDEIYFNPRPPCGGRRFDLGTSLTKPIFQSTSSVWRTT